MEGARQIFTAGVFYVPFIAFIGFGLFVFILGICTLITGSLIFILFASYGVYALLRDTGWIEYAIETCKQWMNWLDMDIVKNIHSSFILKGAEHIPKGPALYICHPHGVIGMGWYYHLCHHWPYSSKRPYLAIHSFLFKFPFLKEILLANNCIDSSEETIRSYLEKGESVAILTGGAEEMLYSHENTLSIVMKKRKGYSKIAEKVNVPIVPLISTNENTYFPQHSSFLWNQFNHLMYRYTKLNFPFPSWKAIQHILHMFKEPLKDPIETFILKPIEPQNKSVEDIRQETIQRIEEFIKEKNLNAKIIG